MCGYSYIRLSGAAKGGPIQLQGGPQKADKYTLIDHSIHL